MNKTFVNFGLLTFANIIIGYKNYHIDHQIMSGLTTISLLSVLLSGFVGSIFAQKTDFSAISSDIFYFSICAIIDSIIINMFLLNSLSVERICSITMTDISYKILYSLNIVAVHLLSKKLSTKLLVSNNQI